MTKYAWRKYQNTKKNDIQGTTKQREQTNTTMKEEHEFVLKGETNSTKHNNVLAKTQEIRRQTTHRRKNEEKLMKQRWQKK